MSDKQDTENAEVYQTESRVDQPNVPAPKKRGFLAHLKHFWWAYFILFICGVVLGVCLT